MTKLTSGREKTLIHESLVQTLDLVFEIRSKQISRALPYIGILTYLEKRKIA